MRFTMPFTTPSIQTPVLAAGGPPVRVRLALLALALGGFGIGTTEFVAMGLLPNIADDLDITIPAAGAVVSTYALGVVVGAPLIAAVGARMPRRTMLIWLMVAYGAGNLLTTIVPGYPGVLAARFLTGLPHGAYFGIAALTAASLVAPKRRASAVAAVMLGLAVANVIGVPAATVIGQHAGWRAAYLMVAGLAVLTVVALLAWVPASAGTPAGGRAAQSQGIASELRVLQRPQVLLALAVGVVGFGGMFSLYTYISPLLTEVTGLGTSAIPLVLALFGIGMMIGNVVGGRMADRALLPGLIGLMAALAAALIVAALVASNPIALMVAIVAVAIASSALVPGLQTRLMDTAGDAQTLAAALNQSALNVANALGAWLGGIVIAAGLGYRAPPLVGAGLALSGLGVLWISITTQRRIDRQAAAQQGAQEDGEPS